MKRSGKFAKMFLNSVGAEGARKALEDLTLVNALMEQSTAFSSLLSNPAFSAEERGKGLEAVSKELALEDKSTRFIAFLAEQGAATFMPTVLRKAVAIYSEATRQVKAIVMTPTAIGDEYEERIKTALKKLVEKDVEIEYEIDPELLGGLVVKVGSTMFDGSIKGQLRLLQDSLIK
jgi:F-type H+-transporting ATPase subunit delta